MYQGGVWMLHWGPVLFPSLVEASAALRSIGLFVIGCNLGGSSWLKPSEPLPWWLSLSMSSLDESESCECSEGVLGSLLVSFSSSPVLLPPDSLNNSIGNGLGTPAFAPPLPPRTCPQPHPIPLPWPWPWPLPATFSMPWTAFSATFTALICFPLLFSQPIKLLLGCLCSSQCFCCCYLIFLVLSPLLLLFLPLLLLFFCLFLCFLSLESI